MCLPYCKQSTDENTNIPGVYVRHLSAGYAHAYTHTKHKNQVQLNLIQYISIRHIIWYAPRCTFVCNRILAVDVNTSPRIGVTIFIVNMFLLLLMNTLRLPVYITGKVYPNNKYVQVLLMPRDRVCMCKYVCKHICLRIQYRHILWIVTPFLGNTISMVYIKMKTKIRTWGIPITL